MKRKLPRGVYKRDGAYWIWYADQTGKIRRESAGPFLKQAVACYQKRKSEVREKKFFPAKEQKKIVLYSQLAANHAEYSRTSGLRDHKRTMYKLATLLDLWKDVPITELSPGKIEHDINELAIARGWKPATRNRYRALVSCQFTRGIKSELCVVNPGKSVEHKIENNERVRWLTPDEEIALIDTVRRMAPELELAVLVALYSGMRRSEQFRCNDVEGSGLKWSYVDLGKKLITIPRSKSGLSREIPIDDVLHDALVKLRATVGSKYVFTIPPPDRRFPRILRSAKIKNFKWHDLRHTFASRLVMAGVDIRTVQILMGHRSIITTMRYAHLSQKHLQEAVDKLHRPVAAAELTA